MLAIFYYLNMRAALEEHAMTSRVLPSSRISGKFVPFVSPSKSLAMTEEDALNLIQKVNDIDLLEFERRVFQTLG